MPNDETKIKVAQAMRQLVQDNERLMRDVSAMQTFLACILVRMNDTTTITKAEIDGVTALGVMDLTFELQKDNSFILKVVRGEAVSSIITDLNG